MMKIRGGLVAAVVAGLVACSGDGLEGPERIEFEEVDETTVEVESGGVSLFGVDDAEEVTVHRWWSDEADFERLDETNTDGQLALEALCRAGLDCRARYEVSVQRRTEADIEVGEGSLDVYQFGGPVEARLGRGTLTATGLTVPLLEAHVDEGAVEIEMLDPPRYLGLFVGEDVEVDVAIPDQTYRCAFDEDSETIETDGMDCDNTVGDAIEIEPDDADVDFELGGVAD